VENKQRPAVVLLAWQCHRLGDQPLAANLLSIALAGMTEGAEVLPTRLAAVEYLWRTQQFPGADELVQTLLATPTYADRPLLWRLGSRLAEERGIRDRAILDLEKALDLEYQHLPELVNLQALRADYGKLLTHYQSLVAAAADLKAAPPADLLARTVRSADRWRALDRDTSQACQAAAEVLQRLGADDLAWDYMTTPYATSTADRSPWWAMAQQLTRKGDFLLADRAFQAAAEDHPDNAQVLWERAQNLRQANQTEQATAVLRRIASRTWPSEYHGVQTQARRVLEHLRE
jgi:tetratricopeptide (TPR) repeat protein